MAVARWIKDNEYELTCEGEVLATGEHNYYDDSDFYALVWNDEQNCVSEVIYSSTRYWSYKDSAKVDATDEVLAKVEAHYIAHHKAMLPKVLDAKRQTVSNGAVVEVVGGRNHKGKVGKVCWMGHNMYNPRNKQARTRGDYDRIGVEQDNGEKFFCPIGYAKVIVPTRDDDVLISEAEYEVTVQLQYALKRVRIHKSFSDCLTDITGRVVNPIEAMAVGL